MCEHKPDFVESPPSSPRLTDAYRASIEAILFAAGDPLSLDALAQLLDQPVEQVQLLMVQLQEDMAQDPKRGVYIRSIEDRYTLATKPQQADLLRGLFEPEVMPALSTAAYETLAIVAYNQPVTRAQVESVRGVNSDGLIQRLLERGLIEEQGYLEAPGRPTLFGTTDIFLESFGLTSTQALPPMELLMYSSLQELDQHLAEATSADPIRRQMALDQWLAPEHDQKGREDEATQYRN